MINIKEKRYEVCGECNKCGQCCLNMASHFDKTKSGVCPHLKDNKDGTFDCLLFGKPERPECCKSFPQAPPVMFEKCSYYFKDKWENNRIVKVKEI